VSKGTAANPDQVPGGDPFDVLEVEGEVHLPNDRLTFSSAYGTCSTTCIQFITRRR
jgi:filamentous hemagglutinin